MNFKKDQHVLDRNLQRRLNLLFAFSVVYILILTLKPFDFSVSYFIYDEKFWRVITQSFGIVDALLNILLFIPLGFLCGLVLLLRRKSIPSIKKWITIFGLSLSLFIECCQLFLYRITAISDVIANGCGTYCGVWLALCINLNKIKYTFAIKKNILKKIVIIYFVMICIILLLPMWLNNFSNWTDEYYLLVGNEATLNRQWKGVIYELAIYDRILEQDEIISHYSQDSINRKNMEWDKGTVALYKFTAENDSIIENKLSDRTLDLIISPTSKELNHKTKNGFPILKGSLLKSKAPAKSLIESIKGKNQFTLELWAKPTTLEQRGPARIVSLSADTDHRNFTLGQVGKTFCFRVRTPLTGLNGSRCEFITKNDVVTTNRQHIIVTFKRGEIKFYINGINVKGKCGSISDYFPVILGFGHNAVSKFLYFFVLLFPLGFLLSLCFRDKPILVILLTISPIILTQIIFSV